MLPLLLAATLLVVPQKQIPTEIVRHGDALWFVSWKIQPTRAWLGRVTPRGKFKLHAAPAGHMPGLTTHAPDGTLWLSDAAKPVLWRVDRAGKIAMVPTNGPPTVGIAFGPDGNLWCTNESGALLRFSTGGVQNGVWAIPWNPPMTSLPPPLPGPKATFITAGPDGAMWFAEPGGDHVGRITMTGEITLFPVPPEIGEPGDLVAARGALWFAGSRDRLGRVSTSGEVSSVDVKTYYVNAVEADDRGRVWFGGNSAVGYVDLDGSVHRIELPDVPLIRSIAVGPDGALWFVDQQNGRIGRVDPSAERH